MFLRSMPTSAVTPSPKRRFDAATCQNDQRRHSLNFPLNTHLERILLLHEIDRRRELPELRDELLTVRDGGSTAMARAGGVLRCVDEPEDRRARRRGHHGRRGRGGEQARHGCILRRLKPVRCRRIGVSESGIFSALTPPNRQQEGNLSLQRSITSCMSAR